jgi:hypothetical protein
MTPGIRTYVVTILAAITLAASSALAQADPALQGEALLRALLEEMRLLRTTMQKNAAAELRLRVLLERARMQQETIRELQREVDQRQMEMEYRMEEDPYDDAVQQTEQRLKTEPDANVRRQIENELSAMRRRREISQRHRERIEQRFRRNEQRLAEEIDRLRTIEDELRRLELSLNN